MATKVTYWKCDSCGKMFRNYEEAYKHERDCHKCETCEYAYYVYGCEFNCDKMNLCKPPEYRMYKEKY